MAQQKDQPQSTPAFFPGQKGLLADQLSWGFGRSPQHWGNYLSDTYSPIRPMPNYPYAYKPPKPEDDKPDKPDNDKPDNPNPKPNPNPNPNPNYYPGGHRGLAYDPSGLQALSAQYIPQTAPQPQYPAGTNPQYAQAMQAQMMPQQAGGLMALNPQALALYRQIYGGQ